MWKTTHEEAVPVEGLSLPGSLEAHPSLSEDRGLTRPQEAMTSGSPKRSECRQLLRKALAVSSWNLGVCPLRPSGLQLSGLICIKVLLTIIGLGEEIYYF